MFYPRAWPHCIHVSIHSVKLADFKCFWHVCDGISVSSRLKTWKRTSERNRRTELCALLLPSEELSNIVRLGAQIRPAQQWILAVFYRNGQKFRAVGCFENESTQKPGIKLLRHKVGTPVFKHPVCHIRKHIRWISAFVRKLDRLMVVKTLK